MTKNVADAIVGTLVSLGVKRIYGIPGDSLNPIMNAIRENRNVEFVQTRHEEGAALEAAFEAKITHMPAVCMGTSGPGSIHLLNGLYEAKMDHVPVIALTGQIETELLGTDYFQEVNLNALMEDVSVYNQQIRSADSAVEITKRAFESSIALGGVSHINMPVDILMQRCDVDEYPAAYSPVSRKYNPDLTHARDLIDHSNAPLLFIGNGCRGYGDAVLRLAERIGSPVIYALNGKGIVDDNDPKVMGSIGLLGTKPSVEAMHNADLLIFLGTIFPYTSFLKNGIPAIQVDINPANLGKRYPVTCKIESSVIDFLEAIEPAEKPEKYYLSFADSKKKWISEMEKRESDMGNPIKPEAVAAAVCKKISAGTVIVADTGNVTVWSARNMRVPRDTTFLISPWLGTMGAGIPGSIGASFATGKPVIAMVGDGSFAMSMMELITARKYNRNIKVVVFNNSKLGMIKFEEMIMGFPEFGVDLLNPDFSKIAEATGIGGFRVERREDLDQTVEKFMAHEGPAVLDVVVDPDEKPMPPKLNFRQVKGFITSILRQELT
ncbi:MAG: thiamine pyrophosphate-binding protein [Candidatus Thermoplasmatota archaeon]|nr:thiamine pyrophosphate-binding protein [Candidatus Thermoplasmatota archaeon]MCL5731694.1 thiamine pyrophosphate-binding protein [Candidatus Thermoplasmatota archaeon]